MNYSDRTDGALKLVPHLLKYKGGNGVILALPRGGVPPGMVLAQALNFPLDLLLVKKIGHPENPELAIGAVSLESQLIDPRFDIPDAYIHSEVSRIRKSLKERYDKFMGDKLPLELKNKTVILVDDGIATGNTILAAVKMIRSKEPLKIVIATPVAPPDTIAKLKPFVEEIICPYQPVEFMSIGQFYDDFSQVSDEEVIELFGPSLSHRQRG
ncbi:MAG TPA: phosphoribosyltransferase family protein [Bacteroidia bacterium]|nr:phosphoribosyltransferase family protein [Bacteroidia bacterium]